MSKKSIVSKAINTERVEYQIGFVCGIIYHDGFEWIVADHGLCSLDPFKHDEERYLFTTEAFAQEHLNKFEYSKEWETFVRPYMYGGYADQKYDLPKMFKKNIVK